MASSFEKLKELDLSRDEVERIAAALKQKEFRKLLADYVDEIQDPQNRKLFQEEIVQLERERGINVTFINPNPGYVIKTSADGSHKCFINVCVNDNIAEPTSVPGDNNGNKGQNWSVPHSLTPPRDDLDNSGVRCQVFDVVFHPKTLQLSEKNVNFRDMLNNIACDAVETNFGVKLDRKNLKLLKLTYKGLPHAAIVKKASSDAVVEREGLEKDIFDKIYAQADKSPKKSKKPAKKTKTDDKTGYTTPKYVVKHRSHVELEEFVDHKHARINAAIPKELVVEVNLPLLKSASDITLDVAEKTVHLISEEPSKYKLAITLPYRVNQDSGNAKFDKDLKKLIIALPVRHQLLVDYSRDDSGVESDQSQPITPESCENPVIPRTSLLEENVIYLLPEFTCHLFDNVIAFTLNVKNVDETSVSKTIDDAGSSIQVKFTSVSPSYYTVHYAFYVKLPSQTITDGVAVETWDNNVVLQVPFANCDKSLNYYYYGLDQLDLTKKYIEEPSILNSVLENPLPEEPENLPVADDQIEQSNSDAINILGTSYESSGDELSCSYSPSKSRGILKRLSSNRYFVGRTLSESSLDDFACSVDNDSPITDEMSTSLKKTVRFSDVIMRQLYRSNSSILGQKKKNQRKSRNKKRAQERRHSESEASEVDDKNKSDGYDSQTDNIIDIFDMDLSF